MPPSEVILIGEQDIDPSLARRYLRAFETFQPDHVTTETSARTPEYLQDRICLFEELLQSELTIFQKDVILNMLGGTWMAAMAYFRGNFEESITWSENEKVQGTYSGQLDDYVKFLRRIQNIIVDKETNFHENHQLIVDRDYFWFLDNPAKHINTEHARSIHERDDVTIDTIMQKEGRVVHCAGLNHVYADYNNLYERLREKGVRTYRATLLDFATEAEDMFARESYENNKSFTA